MHIRRFLSLFFFFGLFLAPDFLTAKHIIGGEVTYTCQGEVSAGVRRYRFTLKVYRDCDGGGATFDANAAIAIYRGNYNNAILFKSFSVGNLSVSKIIPDTPRCIASVPLECVEQGMYNFDENLPVSPDQSYFIVYQRCCRNESINNLVNPGDIGATYFVEVTPAAQQGCNNSPTFKKFPPVIICKGININFDHSATDKDGDILRYSFCSPFRGGGTILSGPAANSCDGATPIPPCPPPFENVPFVAPRYTPSTPVGGDPLVTIDGITGLISGSPDALGQFVVGVCVQEFRNGVLLSTVRRDFQFNVADCQPKVLADIDEDSFLLADQYFYLKSCGPTKVNIVNQSLDPKYIKNFRWSFNLNGTPYVNEKDWNPTVEFPGVGSYIGTLVVNPGQECSDTASVKVDVFPTLDAAFSYDYDTCVAGPVVFKDLSKSEVPIKAWSWNFGVPQGASNAQNPEFLFPKPGNHRVILQVLDENTCVDTASRVVRWFPVPPLIIIQPSTFTGCSPANITFTNLSYPIDETYKIHWRFGDGSTTDNVISPTHLYEEEGVYDVYVGITSPIGCFISDSFPDLIRVEPSPKADFAYTPNEKLSNLNNVVSFQDKSEGAISWFWQFDRLGTSNQRNPIFTFRDTGLMRVTQIVTHARGCKDSLTQILDIVPEIRWFMPNAFTPNGDGLNEGFLGKGYLEGATKFSMTIWNRWGERVFESSDPGEEWNGRKMNTGDAAPGGVYVYLVTFTGPRGEKQEYRGFATLIR